MLYDPKWWALPFSSHSLIFIVRMISYRDDADKFWSEVFSSNLFDRTRSILVALMVNLISYSCSKIRLTQKSVIIVKFIFIIKQSKVLEICFQIIRLNKAVKENPFEKNFIFFKLLTEPRLWSG